MAITGKRNAEMVELLKADFQYRPEPQFGYIIGSSLIPMIGGIKAYWPMTTAILDSVSNIYLPCLFPTDDSAGIPYHIDATATGASLISNGGVVTHWQQAGSDTGNTALITPFTRSLGAVALGGWFLLDDVQANNSREVMVGRVSNPITTRSGFSLHRVQNTDTVRFSVVTGATETASPAVSVTRDQWFFAFGFFVGSTVVGIYIGQSGDLSSVENTTSIPASLAANASEGISIANDWTASLTDYFDGYMSQVFYATPNNEEHIASMAHAIYHNMRYAYADI